MVLKIFGFSSKRKRKESEEQDKQLTFFDKSQFKTDITTVIKSFHAIEDMPSEKLSDIKAKEKTFSKLREESNKYKEISDLYLSFFFGNNLEQKKEEFENITHALIVQNGLFGDDKKINLNQEEKNIDKGKSK